MISYIIGNVVSVNEERLVVENNNIGYNVKIPSNAQYLNINAGQMIKIYTYMYVREDAINLYGFLNTEDLNVFKLLIGVSGIGPKGALAILSIMDASALKLAVAAKDSKSIAKAQGIGAKTAQRVIIDLKDKLNYEDDLDSDLFVGNKALDRADNARADAISALISLGYSDSDSYRCINQLEIDENMSVEDIIKLALKKISM